MVSKKETVLIRRWVAIYFPVRRTHTRTSKILVFYISMSPIKLLCLFLLLLLLAPHIKKLETYFALLYFWPFAQCADLVVGSGE
jgi:hypothetical protein